MVATEMKGYTGIPLATVPISNKWIKISSPSSDQSRPCRHSPTVSAASLPNRLTGSFRGSSIGGWLWLYLPLHREGCPGAPPIAVIAIFTQIPNKPHPVMTTCRVLGLSLDIECNYWADASKLTEYKRTPRRRQLAEEERSPF
jgi:hypothetical protein